MLTHVHPERHRDWYVELARVLCLGGRALLGTQGPSLVPGGGDLTEGWAYVEHEGARPAAFVTQEHTRRLIEGVFSLEEYRPRGHGLTDTYLLVRPG
jgi:hypothetical protein